MKNKFRKALSVFLAVVMLSSSFGMLSALADPIPSDGQVEYADNATAVEVTNLLNGNSVPEITVLKSVTGAGSEKFNGDFTFRLQGYDDFTISVVNGIGSKTIALTNHAYTENAELALVEVAGDLVRDGGTMEYDGTEYTVCIYNGAVVEILKDGQPTQSISFENVFFETDSPTIGIEKTINRAVGDDATFTFEYSYTNSAGTPNTTGSVAITVPMGDLGAALEVEDYIKLPDSYSGTLTITEVDESDTITLDDGYDGDESWSFDGSSYVITYEEGVGTLDNAEVGSTVLFHNNYYAPSVAITKGINGGEIIAGSTPVTYTLTITNNGNEGLQTITVKDDFFAADNGLATLVSDSIKIDGVSVGDDVVAGGKIELSGPLAINDSIVITYQAIVLNVGSALNNAYVSAYGVEAEDTKVDATAELEVVAITPLSADPLVLNVEKMVIAGKDKQELQGSEAYTDSIEVPDRMWVTFRIVVTATGGEYLDSTIEVDVTDKFDGTAFGPDGQKVTLIRDNDGIYRAQSPIFVTTQVRNLTVQPTNEQTNVVTVSYLDAYDTDEAYVTVGKYIAGLDVVKTVAQYTATTDAPTAANIAGYSFEKSVSFHRNGYKGIFKVVITNNSGNDMSLTDIEDKFAGNDIGTIYVDYEGDIVEATLERIIPDARLAVGASLTFYYITDAITTRGTHTNMVTVFATSDDTSESFEVGDSSDIIASWSSGGGDFGGGGNGGGSNGGGNGGGVGTTPEVVIVPEPVPQGDFEPEVDVDMSEEEAPLSDYASSSPEEEVEFIEETPRGALQTGDNGEIVFFAALMALSVLGFAALWFTRTKKFGAN